MTAIRDAKITLGVDPLGGAGIDYWPRIAEEYGLDITIVNRSVDPTFPKIDGQASLGVSGSTCTFRP